MSRGAKAAIAVLGVVICAIAAFFLLFPKIGAWVIRTRVLPRVEARLDRQVSVHEIKVGYGDVALRGVEIRGGEDPAATPLVSVARVSLHFDFWPALTGDLRLGPLLIEEPRFEVRRGADGRDNVSDLVARLRGEGREPAAGGGGRRRLPLPPAVRVERGWVAITDEQRGVKGGIDGIDAEVQLTPPGAARAVLTGAYGEHRLGPRVAAQTLTATADVSDVRRTLAISVENGSAALWKNMSLTGIAGRVAAGNEPGRAVIELKGGYGGAPQELWHAEGWLDRDLSAAEMHLRADRFTLDKIESVLQGTPIVTPANTAIDAALDLLLGDGVLRFSGGIGLTGLTVYHPSLSDEPVKDLAFRGTLKGSYALAPKLLRVEDFSAAFRGVEAHVDGEAALVGGIDAGGLPRAQQRVRAHVVVPQVPCQAMLKALPAELTPRLQGFALKGNFGADVTLAIDWANLDELVLDGSVGIFGCKATAAPEEFKLERLMGEFEHVVEVEENDFISFTVGPSNPEFVPLDEVSPYLINSLMTTEDSGFMKHRGFIVREFRSALIKDLKEGYFKYGASSITMQLVKNVFLYRQKTLSRKLQELFLTWYIEQTLPKERLLEMYVNVIEFGPGLYGIGPAARHYFGKRAKDLNPVESAFFSTILPNPKQRYMQFCEGQMTRWGDAKIQRILKLAHSRGLLTDEEYAQAVATPLIFDRTEALPEADCKKMVKRMLEKVRPTQPKPRGG